MSIQVRIRAKSCCDSITVFDITGPYDAINNKQGYGAPNPEVSDVSSFKLYFKAPGSDEEIVYDAYPYLPNVGGTGIAVYDTDLGVSIDSGVWTIRAELSGTFNGEDFSSNATIYYLATCKVNSCLSKKEANITDYMSESAKEVLDLRTALNAMTCSFSGLKDKVRADKAIKYISQKCANICC